MIVFSLKNEFHLVQYMWNTEYGMWDMEFEMLRNRPPGVRENFYFIILFKS